MALCHIPGDGRSAYHRSHRPFDRKRAWTTPCCLRWLAGADGLDPRQVRQKLQNIPKRSTRRQGIAIGIVKEGFGLPNSEPECRRQG